MSRPSPAPLFVLALALAAAGLPAARANTYSVIDLGVANGWSSRATGVNNSGQVVGNIFNDHYADGSTTNTAFSYSSATGVMTSLRYDTPNPEPVGQSEYGPIRHHNTAAYAINNLGQIAGAINPFGWTAPRLSGGIAASSAGYTSAAVRNPNGSIDFYWVSVPSTSIISAAAYAINQAGEISGRTIPTGVDSWGLSTFLDNYFFGKGNNDLGQQVGYEVGGYTTRLYTAGVWTTIANTLSATNWGFAQDINNHGVVVGGASNNGYQAYRYTVAGGMVQLATKLGALDIQYSDALAINDNGWIVGTAVAANGGGNRAFLYTEADGMIDLNTVLSNSSNLTLLAATAISENGYIAGYGRSSIDGQEHAFLLAPPTAGNVPDKAATLPLFGLAIAGLLAARGRKPLAGSMQWKVGSE